MSTLRKWLEDKRTRGVNQVRVSTVLDRLDEQEARDAEARATHNRPRSNGRVTITADDLVSVAEIARILKVDRARPPKWRLKGTTFGPDKVPFPEPFAVVAKAKEGGTPVWLRSQIDPLIPLVEMRRRKRRRKRD